MHRIFQKFIDQMSSASDSEALREAMAEAAAELDLSCFAYLCMPVCTENLNPNVLTMKSAQYGARIYDAGSLNLARDRRIFVQ
jgi:hypothetical protein